MNKHHEEITLKDLYDLIEKLRKEISDAYVSKTEFEPVKKVVYGLVSLILVAVVTALVALVVEG